MIRLIPLLFVLAAPAVAQEAAAPLTVCTSPSWQVTVFDTAAGLAAALEPQGVAGPVARQSAFGDHALIGSWMEEGYILNLVLRADGSDQIRVQPVGSERVEEAADCGDSAALWAVLEDAG